MPAISTYSPTSDSYVNGVLSGTKWATGSLTYSFPSDASFYGSAYGSGEPTNNFEAFTAAQQIAVRAVLQMYSSVANLAFTEVAETSSVHGDLRYSESDATSTAWAYYPSTSAVGGDAWFNNSKNYYDNPLKGTYGYQTIQHETGHAMGLKHPQDAKGSFGAMPVDKDSLEYTVMSYRSYVGGPTGSYTVGSTSYPQTLMMYDIAGLQLLYGANYTTNAGNTAYKWDPLTGQMSLNGVGQGAPAGNKIFLTVWDGGGVDTYDFSNYASNLVVNLQPGSWTTASSTQLAALGNGHYAAGNIANALLYNNNPASLIENAVGGSGTDTLIGNVAGNRLTGGGGNDVLNGAAGSDIAVYSGMFANYTVVQKADGSWSIVDLRTGSPDGTDTLWNMELLQFSDTLQTLGTQTEPQSLLTSTDNSAPLIVSATATGQVTEWADKSANETANATHTASGSVVYSDANSLDLHTASFTPQGSGYLGTFSLDTTAIDSGDTVGWSFVVSDGAIDNLKAGQTKTQLYDVTINDGHGGTVVQTITVTLSGAGDGPTRGKKARGNEPNDGDDGQGVIAHGRHGYEHDLFGYARNDEHDVTEDQSPAPYTAATDLELTTLLGAHSALAEHWI